MARESDPRFWRGAHAVPAGTFDTHEAEQQYVGQQTARRTDHDHNSFGARSAACCRGSPSLWCWLAPPTNFLANARDRVQ
jgi:hypothetical protein